MSDASFNEQLLTALFDGELEGAERERAEKLLAENSAYQQLFQSWQTQTAGLRALPRYQLDEEFTLAVMEKIESRPVPVTPAAGVLTNWQTGFAAIATLAAMLLLTLFVFPNVTDFTPVANLTTDNEPESLAKSALEEKSSDPERIASAGEKTTVPEADESIAAKTGEFGDATSMKKELADADEGIMSRDGRDYVTEPSKSGASKSRPLEVAENQRRELDDGLDANIGGVRAAARAAPKPKSAAATAANKPSVGRGNDNEADSIAAIAALENQGSAVEQILWIDMQHREQPMAEVETVFARNSIRLLNSDNARLPLDGAQKPAIATDSMAGQTLGAGGRMDSGQPTVFANRSESGMEALFVVATAAQMRQAIVELSDQSDIAGYQVPRNQLQQGFAGRGAGLAADSDVVDSARKAVEQTNQLPGQGNAGLAGQTEGQLGAPVASAQQLMPYPLGKVVDREIQEIDDWFRLPTRQSETELVQYLLLVRTSPADSAAADAKEAAIGEPSDDGSGDK